MIPKYANPYSLLSSTTIVSRAALNDTDEEVEPIQEDDGHAEMIAYLDNILKRSIDDVLPATSQTNGKADEASPRKKRRRRVDCEEHKEGQNGGEESVAVPFRLLSGMSHPKPIVIVPKMLPTVTSQGPAREDTEEEAERRAARARAVAVDFSWVVDESHKRSVQTASKKLTHVVATLPDPNIPMLVLGRPHLHTKPPYISHLNPSIGMELSPHIHEAACCPVITAQPPKKTEKRKRRRGKLRSKPAIEASFWRPPLEMGGKSFGYAWGYPGSRPLQPDEEPRYYRDTAQKGEFA